MKIYRADQIKLADAYTIQHEPIESIDLMERASYQVFNWINKRLKKSTSFTVFCGRGNNGGDGMAIARMLFEAGYEIEVYEVSIGSGISPDYASNKVRLAQLGVDVKVLSAKSDLKNIKFNTTIIDALFGTGLSREILDWPGALIQEMNAHKAIKIAIDVASGLFAENNDQNKGAIFKPDHTLSFAFPKLAFMFPSNLEYVGELVILPIGIHEDFVLSESTNYFTIEKYQARLIHKKSRKFDFKGNYGHALVMAGSYGKMGAAVLAAKATLKSGAGLVTTQIPKCGYDIMQVAIPEVMTWCDKHLGYLTERKNVSHFTSIGVGPGLGTKPETAQLLGNVMKNYGLPMVIDADALNLIARNKELLPFMPKNSILTPHIGEWRRLAQTEQNDFERLASVREFALLHRVIVILKGAHSAVVSPDGEVFFNTTGNPGMATAGSGDVLTGILTGLLAQGYAPLQAAILGVYIHGLAGDFALLKESRESLVASQIIDHLGRAFNTL